MDIKTGINSQFFGEITIKANPPICVLYLEYIVTSNFVRPYPILLSLYVQFEKKPAVKKWLPCELICAIYIVTLNRYPVVT